jgi:hypothetical protein
MFGYVRAAISATRTFVTNYTCDDIPPFLSRLGIAIFSFCDVSAYIPVDYLFACRQHGHDCAALVVRSLPSRKALVLFQ